MDREELRRLLRDVQAGLDVDSALERLAQLPYQDLAFARVDHHRALRHGFPEVIFGEGKRPEHVVAIFEALAARSPRVIATRVNPDTAARVMSRLPEVAYHKDPRMLILDRSPMERAPEVAVLSAGTSDMPVAEEAALTAETMGNGVSRYYDVGVAGLHRLLDVLPSLRTPRAIVVVAGMEGALASVVAGLVAVPVIAVPTSVGYGASLGGIAALLTMLNSCATGVSVVNIDNGFGAGTIASMINRASME